VADCATARVEHLGHFDGDGNRIALFAIKAAGAQALPDGA
jgi:hypothetical protein